MVQEVAGLQGYRVTRLQGCRVTGLQGCRVVGKCRVIAGKTFVFVKLRNMNSVGSVGKKGQKWGVLAIENKKFNKKLSTAPRKTKHDARNTKHAPRKTKRIFFFVQICGCWFYISTIFAHGWATQTLSAQHHHHNFNE